MSKWLKYYSDEEARHPDLHAAAITRAELAPVTAKLLSALQDHGSAHTHHKRQQK